MKNNNKTKRPSLFSPPSIELEGDMLRSERSDRKIIEAYQMMTAARVDADISTNFLKRAVSASHHSLNVSFYREIILYIIGENVKYGDLIQKWRSEGKVVYKDAGNDELLLFLMQHRPRSAVGKYELAKYQTEFVHSDSPPLAENELRSLLRANVSPAVLKAYLRKVLGHSDSSFYHFVLCEMPEDAPLIKSIFQYDPEGLYLAADYYSHRRLDVFLLYADQAIQKRNFVLTNEYLSSILWSDNISKEQQQACFAKLKNIYGSHKRAVEKIRLAVRNRRGDLLEHVNAHIKNWSVGDLDFSLEVLSTTGILPKLDYDAIISKGPEMIQAYMNASEVITKGFIQKAMESSVNADLVVALIERSNYREVKLGTALVIGAYSQEDTQKIQKAIDSYHWYHLIGRYALRVVTAVSGLMRDFSNPLIILVIGWGLLSLGVNPLIISGAFLLDLSFVSSDMPERWLSEIMGIRVLYGVFAKFAQVWNAWVSPKVMSEGTIIRHQRVEALESLRGYRSKNGFDEDSYTIQNPFVVNESLIKAL